MLFVVDMGCKTTCFMWAG